MLFSKAQVIELVKKDLDTRQKKDQKGIELSLAAGLDEIALLMKSIASTMVYDADISASTRELTLSGDNNDLRHIWYIKIGSGESQKLLEYKLVHDFLKYYDSPSASAGVPTYYTQMVSSNGFPTIKFDVPFASADTAKVYYFSDVTPETLYKFRSIATIAQITLAYFHGVETDLGRPYYGNAMRLIKAAQGSDSYHAQPTQKFVPSDHDVRMNTVAKSISNRRY